MTVYWATRLRGFLKHISNRTPDVSFIDKGKYYEVSGKTANLKSRIVRSHFLDLIGLFQIIQIKDKECDFYGSYNRFLTTDKPYFIYLENPTALYHYALGRLRYPAGRKRFQKCLADPNLKYIVCLSEACRSTFEKVNMPLPEGLPMKTIYPLVPRNRYITENLILEKSKKEVLECLFSVQGKSFYNKGGRDVLQAVSRLQKEGYKIRLTVITNVDALQENTLKMIEGNENIVLHDFTFNYAQMEEIYAQTAVLIQPSSADSFSLTVLEAMKAGCAVLGSWLYGFPEMVQHGGNGLLIDPKYWTFTHDNLPNPVAWGYKNKQRLSAQHSQKYIDNIEQALKSMYEDRDMLHNFAKRSLEIADTKFGEETICLQWQEVWKALEGKIYEA